MKALVFFLLARKMEKAEQGEAKLWFLRVLGKFEKCFLKHKYKYTNSHICQYLKKTF